MDYAVSSTDRRLAVAAQELEVAALLSHLLQVTHHVVLSRQARVINLLLGDPYTQ